MTLLCTDEPDKAISFSTRFWLFSNLFFIYISGQLLLFRPTYIMDLESGIWEVSPAAMSAVASKRVTELSKPKQNPDGFKEQK